MPQRGWRRSRNSEAHRRSTHALESGIGFHAARAKALGASREDVISAVLAGLPAAGNAVIQSLPPALAAYDGAPEKADTDTSTG
jgi:alkylhydroperoxidase/carboxymuconolactone decarboxylase family protein YurZ